MIIFCGDEKCSGFGFTAKFVNLVSGVEETISMSETPVAGQFSVEHEGVNGEEYVITIHCQGREFGRTYASYVAQSGWVETNQAAALTLAQSAHDHSAHANAQTRGV